MKNAEKLGRIYLNIVECASDIYEILDTVDDPETYRELMIIMNSLDMSAHNIPSIASHLRNEEDNDGK
jgi:hypothetical protein